MILKLRIQHVRNEAGKIETGAGIIENGFDLTSMTLKKCVEALLPFYEKSEGGKEDAIKYIAARLDNSERHPEYRGADLPGDGTIEKSIMEIYGLKPWSELEKMFSVAN